MVAALLALPALWASTVAAVPPRFNPKEPATWRLSAKLPQGSAARRALVKDWTATRAEPGEEALTLEEAEALLDDPRSELVYGDKTVSIVAPSMLVRQRREHVDLLKVFLQPERLAAGAQFFHAHEQALRRASNRHRVDPAVVVSILLWESNLGAVTGDFFAFNSFTSQAFFVDEANAVALRQSAERKLLDPAKQPERVETIRARARRNLSILVRSCKAKGMDPLSVKGSWAGALGYPQFMPASLRWAEDGDGDGKIDLYSFGDSIASVARYLEEHGFDKSRHAAVWAYNHEEAYVSGVLAWAEALTARLHKGTPNPEAAAVATSGSDGGAAGRSVVPAPSR